MQFVEMSESCHALTVFNQPDGCSDDFRVGVLGQHTSQKLFDVIKRSDLNFWHLVEMLCNAVDGHCHALPANWCSIVKLPAIADLRLS